MSVTLLTDPSSAYVAMTIRFAAATSPAASQYQWFFGDETPTTPPYITTTPATNHIYSGPGTYTARVIATAATATGQATAPVVITP